MDGDRGVTRLPGVGELQAYTEALGRAYGDLGRAYMSFGEALRQAATSLSEAPPTNRKPPGYTQATTAMPWAERTLRQALIVDEIIKCGGTVSKSMWYDIARHYGYEGRGLAGFFRSNQAGLLDLVGEDVTVTENGRERLKSNEERVAYERRRAPRYLEAQAS